MNYTKYLLIALAAASCCQMDGMVNLATGSKKLLQRIVQKTGIQERLWRHAVNKIDLSCLEGQQTWLNHLMGALTNLDENRIYYLRQYAAAFYAAASNGTKLYTAKPLRATPYGGPRYRTKDTDPYDYHALMFLAIETALKNKIDADHITRYFADSSYNARMILFTMTNTCHYDFVKNDPDTVAAGKFLIDKISSNSDWIESLIATKNPNAWLQEVIAYAKSKRNS